MQRETETYQKIISAAVSCFGEKGFNATSIRDIAIRAKISQGAMYTYFRSKENLIEAIISEEQKTALMKHDEHYNGSHFDRILELFTGCVREAGYTSTHQLWVEVIAESARKDQLRTSYLLSDKIMRRGVAKIIQRGVESGEFSPAVNSEEATIMIFSLVCGLVARKAISPSFDIDAELPGLRAVFAVILNKLN